MNITSNREKKILFSILLIFTFFLYGIEISRIKGRMKQSSTPAPTQSVRQKNIRKLKQHSKDISNIETLSKSQLKEILSMQLPDIPVTSPYSADEELLDTLNNKDIEVIFKSLSNNSSYSTKSIRNTKDSIISFFENGPSSLSFYEKIFSFTHILRHRGIKAFPARLIIDDSNNWRDDVCVVAVIENKTRVFDFSSGESDFSSSYISLLDDIQTALLFSIYRIRNNDILSALEEHLDDFPILFKPLFEKYVSSFKLDKAEKLLKKIEKSENIELIDRTYAVNILTEKQYFSENWDKTIKYSDQNINSVHEMLYYSDIRSEKLKILAVSPFLYKSLALSKLKIPFKPDTLFEIFLKKVSEYRLSYHDIKSFTLFLLNEEETENAFRLFPVADKLYPANRLRLSSIEYLFFCNMENEIMRLNDNDPYILLGKYLCLSKNGNTHKAEEYYNRLIYSKNRFAFDEIRSILENAGILNVSSVRELIKDKRIAYNKKTKMTSY